MKLKISKPDYKGERQLNQVNYYLLGKLIEKEASSDKIGFKSNFNQKINMKIKKHIANIDIHEHKHQIGSLFKLYNNTMRKQPNANSKNLSSKSDRRGDNTTIKDKNRTEQLILTQLHLQGNTPKFPYCDFPSMKSFREKRMKRLRISWDRSPLKCGLSDRSRSKVEDSLFHLTYCLPRINHCNSTVNIFKDSHSFLKDEREKKHNNRDDRNILFEKLTKKHHFYIGGENSFDKNKWKLFKSRENIKAHLLPKHSIHYIQSLHKKEAQRESSP